MSDADKVTLCKRYFYIGFALLPLVWIVNAVWFFECAFFDKQSPVQKTIKQCEFFTNLLYSREFITDFSHGSQQ